jgi:long-chain fatty acid transport protein
MQRSARKILMAMSALGTLVLATGAAEAGGFGLHEQSTYGLGVAFAGVSAGGTPSSMYWNPATMTQFSGLNSEWDVTGIIPQTSNTPTVATTATGVNLLPLGGTGNVGASALVPASYTTWQVMQNLWLGLSTNSPWGLSTNFPDSWAGRNYALSSSAQSINATPSVALRLNDWISFGAGVQIQWFNTSLTQGITAGPGPCPPGCALFNTNLQGSGWGYGFTAGVTLTPTPATQIGLGWRSGINQPISGTLFVNTPAVVPFIAPFTTAGSANTTINLPDVVSLGLRQRVSPQLTVMGTVEWTNWSRIGTSFVTTAGGGPALVAGFPVAIPFQYKDGWLYSMGVEYQADQRWSLRAGAGYEVSPVTDTVRVPLIPDNNRLWLSTGATFAVAPNVMLDFAYSHIFVQDSSINISPVSGNPSCVVAGPVCVSGTYIGTVSSSIDILSVGLRYKWNGATQPLVTKG